MDLPLPPDAVSSKISFFNITTAAASESLSKLTWSFTVAEAEPINGVVTYVPQCVMWTGEFFTSQTLR